MSSKNSKTNNFINEMWDLMRRLHYSIHTENACCDWVTKYIHFHKMQVVNHDLFDIWQKAIKDCPYRIFLFPTRQRENLMI